MLPNWIILGAPKCLTSSLFRWLVDHPQVCGPADKETYYFVDPGSHMFRGDRNFRDHGHAGYERLFADCDPSARVIVEATPGYLYSQTALRELPRLASGPSFIVVLREPVAQLRSLHRYFQQNWNWIPRDMSFAQFVDAVESGQASFGGNELAANALANASYPAHLRPWQAAAGDSRLVILLFEDLVRNSSTVMARLANRMGIDPGFYRHYEFPAENRTYVVRSAVLQQLNIAVRSHLPQGRAYRAVRRLYRSLNTRRPDKEQGDLNTDRMLSRRYLPMVGELEQEFGLDMTAWKAVLNSRLAEGRAFACGDQNPSEQPRPAVPAGLLGPERG